MSASWDRIRVFEAVARHGSINAAAQELHVTAPGVSQHIKGLERELGVALIQRVGRGIGLTAAGRVFADRASTAARSLSDGAAELEAMQDSIAGPVRIGGVATALRALAPALRTLLNEHPLVDPTVVDGEITDLLPQLERGELDVVITESWDTRPLALPAGLTSRTLAVERVWVALPADHRFAAREAVPLRELRDEQWTSCAAGSDPYEALKHSFGAEAGELDIAYRVGDMATQITFVASGLAVALVTDLALPWSAGGVAFRQPDPPAARTIAAATCTGRLRPAVVAVIDRAAEHLPQVLARSAE